MLVQKWFFHHYVLEGIFSTWKIKITFVSRRAGGQFSSSSCPFTDWPTRDYKGSSCLVRWQTILFPGSSFYAELFNLCPFDVERRIENCPWKRASEKWAARSKDERTNVCGFCSLRQRLFLLESDGDGIMGKARRKRWSELILVIYKNEPFLYKGNTNECFVLYLDCMAEWSKC